jgi:hypothetical protein
VIAQLPSLANDPAALVIGAALIVAAIVGTIVDVLHRRRS